ncbi:cytochrome P450 monooxygenase [Bombardia bombarda]|uniref:Cytochrome P450 monooxygenase n=1 Tax=Bombardia bombarda TaxID=252184 RepID=A0AA39X1G1_9PEZI|nr:cytochrome P450 monooxygenase [Bombardia bombarda]
MSRPDHHQSPAIAVGLLAVTILLFVLYRIALPKPLAGIPYNVSSSRKLFGDVPGMLSHIANEDGTFITYLEQTLQRLNAPLVQIFIKPMSQPLLVLGDFPEARDIMTRRTKEFDRSTSSGDLVRGLGSSHHIHLKTTPAWRAQRRLIQDLMTPSFLNKVAGPVMHQNASLLIDLWRAKTRIAAGRPFTASADIDQVALDAVLVFAFGERFGEKHSAIRPALDAVRDMMQQNSGGGTNGNVSDEPVVFPTGVTDPVVSASLELVATVEDVQGSPLPDLKWWFINSKPRVKRATKIKEDAIKREVEDAIRRLNGATGEEFVKSAVDHMVFRERTLAEKDGRRPDFFSRIMMDEIFGFIIAGNDTSSTSISWGVKYLADHPSAQTKLRQALESAFASAAREGRSPSIQEITDTHNVAYLDAVIEETLRCSATVPVVDRQATVDTELLGYHIPKGSVVTCLVTGPSMMSPALEIDEARRSETGRLAKKSEGRDGPRAWDLNGMASFQPERWLTTNSKKGGDGSIEFDAAAGPQLAFGLGTRQCYGKRLALLEMRILITLIVWNFELLPCPPALSGDKPILIMTNRPKDCYVRLREVKRGKN